MKTREYETKTGEKKTEYKLEDGDLVESMWNNPNKKQFGDITKYSIKVKYEGKEIYLTLTEGQYKNLERRNENLNGKILLGEKYDHVFTNKEGKEETGTFVGIKVK